MIQVSHLIKYYGDFLAVDDLSFEIEDGHVYGFLGPNGAGKSTTMNIMTGCLSPTQGSVKINDYDILQEPEKAKKLIGYLPEQPPLYPNETPEEYLTFVGEAKGLRGSELKQEIEDVIKNVGIENVKDRLIGTLSKGYKQRVGIAQALLGNPEVIILDEPTVGLDPIQIIEIRDLIKELGKSHTVILSSHILSEVQTVCEKVLIISKGKLVAFDAPENLEKLMLSSTAVTFEVEANKKDVEKIMVEAEGIKDYDIKQENDVCAVNANLEDNQDSKIACGKLTMLFASKGLPIFEMKTKKANLEDVFLELTESGSAEELNKVQESNKESEVSE
jgi:ABC-2 type transport system ATP-binding protein